MLRWSHLPPDRYCGRPTSSTAGLSRGRRDGSGRFALDPEGVRRRVGAGREGGKAEEAEAKSGQRLQSI